MESRFPKRLFVIFALLAVAGTAWFFIGLQNEVAETPEVVTKETLPIERVIGTSVQGRDIKSYTFGEGSTHILLVGGIHGGYEWNAVMLAYRVLDQLERTPAMVPDELTVTVIPSLNPDGLFAIVGSGEHFALADVPEGDVSHGRFNANGVDLNRNFDCKWQAESMWRGNVVSAGEEPFSEPEAAALRDFVRAYNPRAVVFWHSQSGDVYGSQCEDGTLSETVEIMNTYAQAADYGSIESFDAYPVTGDAEGWLASIGIPAITVELTTHEVIEFGKNIAGVTALFDYYTTP